MKKALLYAALVLSGSAVILQAQVTNIMQGLVSYWPMDGAYTNGTGQIYTPDVIQGNDLLVTTNNGATGILPRFIPGMFGNCVSNTGSSLEIYFATNWLVSSPQSSSATGLPIAMTPTTNFTVSLWVMGYQSNILANGGIYSECSTNTTDGNTYHGIESGNPASSPANPSNCAKIYQRFTINGNSAQNLYGSTSPIIFTNNNPTWHHCVEVVSNTTQYLYVDGTLKGSCTWVPPNIVSPGAAINQLHMVQISAFFRSTANWNGAACMHVMEDDVAVWNRALSPGEIMQLATNTSALGGATNIQAFPPYFSRTPVGGSVAQCANISLSGVAVPSATPTAAGFTYQWQQDGTNATGPEFTGQNTTNLTITSAQTNDAGMYTLIATFAYATNPAVQLSVTSATVMVTVVSVPSFTSIPAGTGYLWPGDSWSLNFGVSTPCGGTYAWLQNGTNILQDGATVQGSATPDLMLTGLDLTNSGFYQLIVYYNAGANSVTSAPVSITVNPFSSSGNTPDLTNGLIAYWPLYTIQGTKTPDIVNGYDMTVVGSVDVGDPGIPDHAGGTNSMYLNGSSQYCYRIDSTNDLVPAINYPAFSVAFWVQALGGSTSQNYGSGPFGMADTYGGASFLTLYGNTFVGNASQAQLIRPYYRVIGGSGYDLYFSTPVFDGTWHHVVYIQRPYGTNYPGQNPTTNSGTNTKNVFCQMYVDGNPDPTSFFEIWPLTNSSEPRMNTDAIGTAYRSVGAGSTMTGSISDVAEWNRVLSAAEVQQLYTTGMPAITPNIPLMSISSFLADAPEVAQGGKVTLSWNTSAYATQISIDQGVGNVYPNSVQGVGSVTLTNLQQSKTYTLTVSRGTNVVTAQIAVGVLSGLNAGWKPLDTFDEYSTGPFNGAPYWTAASFGYCAVAADPSGNHLLHLGGTTAFEPEIKFNLGGNTMTINSSATLFFRFVTGNNLMDPTGTTVVTPVDYVIGLSDWSGLRFYGDTTSDVGPDLYLGTYSGVFAVGAKDGYGNVVNWATGAGAVTQPDGNPLVLSNNMVYDVWLDVTNNDIVNVGPPDYNVWIAPENDLSNQTEVFSGYIADRSSVPTGDHAQEIQNLSVVFMGGGSDDTNGVPQVLLDDFYINTNGYNHTVPRPYGLTTAQGVSPSLTITPVISNGQIQLYWSGGVLASAPSLLGPWTPVDGATVPYYVAPATNSQTFFATLPSQ